jgi:uncharacterized metal-binding protein YceD (DUF177 family)
MRELKEFDIEVIRLTNGKHLFEYTLGDSFFQLFPDTLVDKGSLVARVELEKNDRLMMATFAIEGTITLICDRSLEEFEEPVSFTEKLTFKYGEEFVELSEEIIQIPYDTQKLNLAQYLYEFIGLQVPMKKLHPKFRKEEEDEDYETSKKFIYKSDLLEDEDTFNTDPRWDALKKIKKDLNDE